MSANSGIIVASTVKTPDSTDNIAVVECNDAKGGLHSVATTTARNAIKSSRLIEGMRVYVIADGTTYRLNAGYATPPIDSDWTIDGTSSGSSATIVTAQHSGDVMKGSTLYLSQSQLQDNLMPLYVATGACTVSRLQIVSRVSNGAGVTDTYTVVKNGVDQTMVASVTNSTTGFTITNPVTLAANDVVALKVATGVASVASDVLAVLTIT